MATGAIPPPPTLFGRPLSPEEATLKPQRPSAASSGGLEVGARVQAWWYTEFHPATIRDITGSQVQVLWDSEYSQSWLPADWVMCGPSALHSDSRSQDVKQSESFVESALDATVAAVATPLRAAQPLGGLATAGPERSHDAGSPPSGPPPGPPSVAPPPPPPSRREPHQHDDVTTVQPSSQGLGHQNIQPDGGDVDRCREVAGQPAPAPVPTDWVCECSWRNRAANEICGGSGPLGCNLPRPVQRSAGPKEAPGPDVSPRKLATTPVGSAPERADATARDKFLRINGLRVESQRLLESMPEDVIKAAIAGFVKPKDPDRSADEQLARYLRGIRKNMGYDPPPTCTDPAQAVAPTKGSVGVDKVKAFLETWKLDKSHERFLLSYPDEVIEASLAGFRPAPGTRNYDGLLHCYVRSIATNMGYPAEVVQRPPVHPTSTANPAVTIGKEQAASPVATEPKLDKAVGRQRKQQQEKMQRFGFELLRENSDASENSGTEDGSQASR